MELLCLCLKIFFGRLIDVTLSTMQTMYLVKGRRKIATILGFIDVLIWFIVVKEALNTELESVFIALAYAGGYAAGTFTGSGITKKIMRGTVSVQVITKNIKDKVTNVIKENGYSASIIESKGIYNGEANYMIYAQVDNRKLNEFKEIITKADPNAFITVTESKEILNGYLGK